MRVHGSVGLLTLVLVIPVLLVSACQTGPRSAPVLDRKIDASEASEPSRSRRPAKAPAEGVERKKSPDRDWRPESYTVNRGDTLYAIALDHGLDYRELAARNAIADPNRIQVGQKLSLRPPTVVERPAPVESPAVVSKASSERTVPTGEVLPAEVPVKSEPRAERIPYSEEAYTRTFGTAPQTVAVPATVPDPKTKGSPAELPGSASSTVQPSPTTSPPVTTPAPPAPPPAAKAAAGEPVVDTLTWSWPARGEIIATFDGTRSKGIVIAGNLGDPVVASNAGKVVYVGRAIQTYGALVILKHGADFLTVYAHNSAITVNEGQWVTAGQKIAEMGERSPKVTALHFELRRLGQPVDPGKYLPAR
ncbi:MAG: LysM peptidoglycan-binding domain-containing protein [Betaproteobacteria bacterium]|nr:LysM peptidoglycan-binding domain-containing protein [Betaproteobacteria bacterium]